MPISVFVETLHIRKQMREIKKAIKNVKRQLVMTKFVDSFLDSLLLSIFLVCVLLLFQLKFFYAFLAGLIFVARGIFKAIRKSSLEEIEKKIPGLRWQLRTASDNLEKDNEIVKKLHEEVYHKIGYVTLFDLFSGKRTILRVALLFVLVISFIYIKSSGMNLIGTVENAGEGGKIIADKIGGMFIFEGGDKSLESTVSGNNNDGENPTGDSLEFGLNPEENVANLDELKKEERKDFKGRSFTGKINEELDSSYSENIDSEDEEIIRNYYDNLNKQ